MVDGKIQTVEWEDDPNVEDIYEDDGADAWEEWEDIDVEDLYDLVEAKAGGNDTPIVREDWELLAKQEAKLRKLGKAPEDLSFQPEMTKPGFFKRLFGKKPKALTEPKFAIMDDDELDAFESLVQEANDYPMQQANASNVTDAELADFFEAEFGFKPDGSLEPVVTSEENVIDFDAYIKANENVQTTTLMEDLGLPPAEYSDPVEIDEFKAQPEPEVFEPRSNGIEEMGPDVLNELADFEHVMAPFEIEEGQPLLEAAQVAGEDVGMWEALVGAVKGGAPVMGFNPGLSTKGITKHDEYMQQRLEDYRYRQRHEILWWQDKGVWIYIAGYWYLGHTVDFEGSYLTKVPIEKRWTTEVRVEYHFYDQGQLVKQQTKWLDPNSGSPPMKSFQDTQGRWNPDPLDIGYWRPGTDPYAVWQQKASDLIGGVYYRKPGSIKWRYLRKEPITFDSKPGQVTLNYNANQFEVVDQDTMMECAWRVRDEEDMTNVPNTDLWALEELIQQEQDRRFEDKQRTEQADALQEWQYLRDECARLADLTYGNPPLHERLDFMSWGSSVEDIDAMTLLVQEAEDWLASQQPKDEPFDPDLIFEPLDTDVFDTTQDHTEKLYELHEKARVAQEWVPKGGDLYWELMDAQTLPWEERERIKNAIRRAKAYKQMAKE